MTAESKAERALHKGAAFTAGAGNTMQASATDAMIEGMAEFMKMAERMKNKAPELRSGHLFEAIVSAKENAEHALRGSSVKTEITHVRDHRAAADLVRTSGNRVMSEAQLKFSNDPKWLAESLLDSKYEGMDLIVPSDKIEAVRAELLNVVETSNDPTTAERVRSALKRLQERGTDTQEVMNATKDPTGYARAMEAKQVLREMGTTVAASAASAAVVAAAVAAVKNGLATARGELTAAQAAKETAIAAGKGAVHGAGIGAVGTGVRYAAKKVGQEALAKSNVAMSVASGIIDVGVSVYQYAKGDLSAEEAAERIGETGLSAMSGLYAGAVAGAFFGPIGMVVGSVAGFFISSSVWQTCLSVLRSARLAEEESARLVALLEAAAEDARRQREEIEYLFSTRLQQWREHFDATLFALDASIEASDPDRAVAVLGAMAALFGRELQFASFEEFDDFMVSGEEPLVL